MIQKQNKLNSEYSNDYKRADNFHIEKSKTFSAYLMQV